MTDKTWKIGILFCCDKCNMPMQITCESKLLKAACGLCGSLNRITTEQIISEFDRAKDELVELMRIEEILESTLASEEPA